MPRYTAKNIRATWSEDALLKALDSVKNGMSLRKASSQYGIPRTTLLRRQSNLSIGKIALGGKPVLGDMEEDLVSHVLDMERTLFGITARDLRKLAYQVNS